MTDNVTIDGEGLAAVSASLDAAVLNIPLGEPLSLSNTQSSKVIAAANSFNMWSALTSVIARDVVQRSADDIIDVARTFGDWDAQAAKIKQGMI